MIFDKKRNKQIVTDLAKSYENEETNSQESSEASEPIPPTDANSNQNDSSDKSSAANNNNSDSSEPLDSDNSHTKTYEDDENSSPNISANALRKKKGELNLEERKKLLSILKFLFGAQLFFMNVVVIVIVLWVVLELPFLRIVEDNTLTILVDMTKYYITAVLVELLGGIIYIVHNVFSDKTIDKLNS